MAAMAAGWRATLTYPSKVSVADHPPSKYQITSAFVVPAKLIEEPPAYRIPARPAHLAM
jgi:hypothetical protein